MAELDHSTTVLIMKPVGPAATDSLGSQHNTGRLISFHFDDAVSSFSLHDSSRSRECTPYGLPPPEIELHLKFNPGPKNRTRGFVFGTNEKKCDVVLLDNPAYCVSGQHFCVNFNWESGFLVLYNIARFGTGIRAPSVKNGYQLLKHNNQRMLHPAEQTRISVGTINFDLSFPIRDQQQGQLYQRNWEAFRAQCVGAVPDVSGLDIESPPKITTITTITTITNFGVRRESRHHAYILHDVIGSGEFGTVCKAMEERTAKLFAAKQFKTTRPGWDTKANLEITLSRKVDHEHIVSFVDFIDDGGGPVLVMEYLSEGNLMKVHQKSKLSSEETRTVLRQTLQALAYLHDKKITHRDIKPANILVRSRNPELFIKLCDFGLSTEKSALETCCGTDLYAAAEISQKRYSNAVDIWAIGVVALQFIKGLPKPDSRLTAQDWCQMIRRRLEPVGQQVDDPVIPLLKRMLELKPQDRPSAQACLADPLMRSLQQSSQSGTESSDGETESVEAISEQPTEIWHPLWQVSDDSKLPNQLTGLKDPRKRLRSSESISTIQEAKRAQRKSQAENTPGFTDLWEEEMDQLRREEKDVSTSKADNCRTSPLGDDVQSLERTYRHTPEEGVTEVPPCAPHPPHGRHHSGLPSEVPRPGLPRVHIATGQTGRKSIRKRATPPAKRFPLIYEDVSQVVDADAEHVQMEVDNQLVLMRKDDCCINATQILSLAKKTPLQCQRILEFMEKKTKVEKIPVTTGSPYRSSWIGFQDGRALCRLLELEEKLQPLMDYGLRFHPDEFGATAEMIDDFLTKPSEFIEIRQFSNPVMVSRMDFRINASNIFRLAGRPRRDMQTLKKTLRPNTYEYLAGPPERQGTYVDFDIGIECCRKYGLAELEKQLLSLKPVSPRPVLEEPVVDTQPSHDTSPTQFPNRVSDSPRHTSVSPQHVSAELNRPQGSAGGPMLHGPIQSEHECKSDFVSDNSTTSESSLASNERFSPHHNARRKAQEILSIDLAKEASSPQSDNDDRSSLPEGIDLKSQPAEASHCSYWDSEPPKSRLSEARLDLKAHSRISSRYGSTTDESHLFLGAMGRNR